MLQSRSWALQFELDGFGGGAHQHVHHRFIRIIVLTQLESPNLELIKDTLSSVTAPN